MTLQAFIEKWNGKQADFDGKWPGQCTDLYRFYVRDVLGLPQTPSVEGAKDIWTKDTSGFEKIKNTPAGVPNKGDVMIWGTVKGPYGHVAICTEANVNTFTCFSQNDPVGALCGLKTYKSYRGVLGWLRSSATINPPANSGGMEPVSGDQTKIDLGNPQGVLEIQAIRSRLKDNEESIKIYQEQVKDLGVLIDDLKSSYGQEIIKLTEKEKATKEAFDNFLFKVAGLLGESQDIPTIIAALNALVFENATLKNKLEGITGNQPIVIHNGLSKVVEFIEKIVKKVITNLKKKYGKTKKGRNRASVG